MQSFADKANPPPNGLIIDNFAGRGGASTGIEKALGVSVSYAINHDPEALCMHEANHPRQFTFAGSRQAVGAAPTVV
jgi:site-specific DNA-cytosine methylase